MLIRLAGAEHKFLGALDAQGLIFVYEMGRYDEEYESDCNPSVYEDREGRKYVDNCMDYEGMVVWEIYYDGADNVVELIERNVIPLKSEEKEGGAL